MNCSFLKSKINGRQNVNNHNAMNGPTNKQISSSSKKPSLKKFLKIKNNPKEIKPPRQPIAQPTLDAKPTFDFGTTLCKVTFKIN